eukprot:11449688-Alexandrium_andersonii.AAC.1
MCADLHPSQCGKPVSFPGTARIGKPGSAHTRGSESATSNGHISLRRLAPPGWGPRLAAAWQGLQRSVV